MKILVVTQYFWPENFKINDICDALVEKGHQVTVLTGLPNYPKGKLFNGYGFFGPYVEQKGKIKIYRVPIVPRGKNKGIQLILNYLSFVLSASIFAFFFSPKADIHKIFVYGPSPATKTIPAIILKKLTGAPLIYWVTDLWPDTLITTGVIKSKFSISLWHKIINFIYSNCDKILVSSKGFVKKIREQNIPSTKIAYWPQWAEALFEERPKSIPQNIRDEIPEGLNIMFAGNIGTSQSFETIIEAAKLIKHKTDINWIILGDGLMKKWVEKEVNKHQLHNFKLLGTRPMETMPAYYSQCDILLASLKKDPLFEITLPAKIQSYLPSGKPIIVSMDGEGARLIEESEAGLYCRASDPQALANTVMKAYEMTQNERNKMGDNARQYFQNNFTRKILLKKLEQYLAE